MPISIYIDNNVWDFLFDRKIDLATALPKKEFCLCMTREAEFEIPPIPPHRMDFKEFIEKTIERASVRTDYLFGFFSDGIPPEEQRFAGFDVGRWATEEEIAFIAQQRTRIGAQNPKTKLFKNEADCAIAARSFHSVVLTLDKTGGPINDAYRQGGKVVYLTDFDNSHMSLAAFIRTTIKLC